LHQRKNGVELQVCTGRIVSDVHPHSRVGPQGPALWDAWADTAHHDYLSHPRRDFSDAPGKVGVYGTVVRSLQFRLTAPPHAICAPAFIKPARAFSKCVAIPETEKRQAVKPASSAADCLHASDSRRVLWLHVRNAHTGAHGRCNRRVHPLQAPLHGPPTGQLLRIRISTSEIFLIGSPCFPPVRDNFQRVEQFAHAPQWPIPSVFSLLLPLRCSLISCALFQGCFVGVTIVYKIKPSRKTAHKRAQLISEPLFVAPA